MRIQFFFYDFLSFSILHVSICNIWIGNRNNLPKLAPKHVQTSFISMMIDRRTNHPLNALFLLFLIQ